MLKKIILLIIVTTTAFTLTSCNNFFHKGKLSAGKVFGVYKIDIPQGNIISEKQLSQIKYGMSKNQVIYVLGDPVLSNIFNENSLSYIYFIENPYSDPVQKTVIFEFESDSLVKIEQKYDPKEKKRKPIN